MSAFKLKLSLIDIKTWVAGFVAVQLDFIFLTFLTVDSMKIRKPQLEIL